MKQKLITLLLAGCLLGSMVPASAAAAFTDISDPDTALAAGVLQGMGIVGGVSEGVYSPDTELTRAQFCVLMVHTLGMKDLVGAYNYKTLFTDVKPGSWYTGYVNLAYTQQLLAGYGNGTFGPDDPVTYGQAATLLLRILGYASADIGKVWPTDYVNYAHTLELDEGLSLSADDHVTRAQAAILLYNTLNTESKGAQNEFYKTFDATASIQKAVVLDVDARHGTAVDQLMVCKVGAAGASIEYYSQKNQISEALIGYEGDLLLNSAGKVLGFMPSSTRMEDVVVSSAKASGVTDAAGTVHRISGSAVTIIGDDLYTWNDTGYMQVNSRPGKTARLYYNDDGSVCYVYLFTGRADADTQAIVAQTNSTASELIRKLGVTAPYTITKNGVTAQAGDLARYDTAYYDKTARTLCVSDYQLTGYIEAASPTLDAAQTITVSGCMVPVLECAWDSLSALSLGDRVTLFLTDDCQAAAATTDRTAAADTVGVLSTDGRSITLCSSGLVITSSDVEAEEKLYGRLVRVTASEDELRCYAYSSPDTAGRLDIAGGTLGSYELAPAFQVYEAASGSYLYSLSGQLGVPSTDFEEIFWTDTLAPSKVASFRLNSAGQVDLLVLENVTGNCYQYGKVKRYTDSDGIVTDASGAWPVVNNAATVTNAAGESQKYLSNYALGSFRSYHGVALHSWSGAYQEVTSLVTLTASSALDAGSFFLDDDDWYAVIGGSEIPVSDNVQVYVSAADRWLSGHEGMRTAVSSGLTLTAHYDQTLTTGAQVRVLVVGESTT